MSKIKMSQYFFSEVCHPSVVGWYYKIVIFVKERI